MSCVLPISGLTEETLSASKSGAHCVGKAANSIREKVYTFIQAHSPVGVTDREMQQALELDGNTQRPRRWELWLAGRIQIKRDVHGQYVYRTFDGKCKKHVVWIAQETTPKG